ncbi:hypothetical protein [Ensifer soli]
MTPLLATAGLAVLSLVTFHAFDGWLAHGSDILLAMAANGLSWCF